MNLKICTSMVTCIEENNCTIIHQEILEKNILFIRRIIQRHWMRRFCRIMAIHLVNFVMLSWV